MSPWGALPNATGKPAEPMAAETLVEPVKMEPFVPWLVNVWAEDVLPIAQVFSAAVMAVEGLAENAPEISHVKKAFASIPCSLIAVRSA